MYWHLLCGAWRGRQKPFIAELLRAANEVSELTAGERINLLLRAFHIIRELRLETASGTGIGAICSVTWRLLPYELNMVLKKTPKKSCWRPPT